MTSFMLILPIAAIVAFIIIIIRFNAWTRLVPAKITHWLLLTYVVVLVASFLFSFFNAEDISVQYPKVKAGELRKQIYDTLSRGNVDQIDQRYVMDQRTFDYQDRSLSVVFNGQIFPRGISTVFVDRKPVNDDKIEVFVIGSALLVNGIDFTDKLAEMDFEINGSNLVFYQPEYKEVKITIVKTEFPINQITSHKVKKSRIDEGKQMIYLRIPKNLEVNESEEIEYKYVAK